MTGSPDASEKPKKPPGKLVRISYDESRTTADMVEEITRRGGRVDAASDLWGIMQVLIDDPTSLADIAGVRSVMQHRMKRYW